MLQRFVQLFGSMNADGEFIFSKASYVALVIVVLLLLLIPVFLGKNSKLAGSFKVRQLTFAAMAIALAMVTSYIKLLSLPFGGSITLFSMFFICFVGYLYGSKVGITTAVAYGLFQLITEPYVIHPAQLVLDYVLAFGALGLSGFVYKCKWGLVKGCVLGMFGRFVCSFLSGCIFFSSYAPEGMNPILYSFAYNGLYIGVEAALTIVILSIPPVAAGVLQVKKMAAPISKAL